MRRVKELLRNKEFLLLNSGLILFFCIVVILSPFRPSESLLLYASDAVTYIETGGEFFNFSKQGFSITRPFLYSSFLKFTHFVGGAWFVFICQSIIWLISANIIYVTAKLLSHRFLTRVIAVSLYALNFSIITYVFHGLTEVFSIFLISILTYTIVKTIRNGFHITNALYIVFLLGLLTVTKPLFAYPFAVFLLIIILRFGREFLKQRKYVLLLFIYTSPVLLQLSVMKIKYDFVKISTIGDTTFHTYLIAQGIRKIEGITDVEKSQQMALNMPKEERNQYLLKHKKVYFNLYLDNIKKNITGDSRNFITIPGYNTQRQVNYMTRYNTTLYHFSKVFLILFIICSFIDFLQRKLFKNWQFLFLGLLLYYIVFSSGISFWQGDRLIVFSIPLWITLYILLTKRVINSNFAKRFFPKKITKNEIWSD